MGNILFGILTQTQVFFIHTPSHSPNDSFLFQIVGCSFYYFCSNSEDFALSINLYSQLDIQAFTQCGVDFFLILTVFISFVSQFLADCTVLQFSNHVFLSKKLCSCYSQEGHFSSVQLVKSVKCPSFIASLLYSIFPLQFYSLHPRALFLNFRPLEFIMFIECLI